MRKGQKGITLVALVITIIVMLILTGVTITLALDGGLLTQAGKAKNDTQDAANVEDKMRNGWFNYQGKYVSINNVIDGTLPTN